MRTILLLIIAFTIFTISGCCSQKVKQTENVYQIEIQKLSTKYDSLLTINNQLNSELQFKQDSIDYLLITSNKYDSINDINLVLARELLNSQLMIENARYYVNIVNRNSTQSKFLLGWMNRVLEIK